MELLRIDWNLQWRVWRVLKPSWKVFQLRFYLLLTAFQETIMVELRANNRRCKYADNIKYLSPRDAALALNHSSDSDNSAEIQRDPGPENPNVTGTRRTLCLFGGIALTLLGSFQMSLNSVIVKHVSNINASEMALFRFLILFILSLPYVIHSQNRVMGVPGQRLPLFLRGALGGVSIYLSYCATKLMPIAEASIIISTTPIFVTILARIYLKEKIDAIHIVSLTLTVAGLCLLVRLPVIIMTGSTVKFANTSYWVGFSCAFLSAFTGACALVFVRKLKAVHVSVIIFNFSWIAIIEMLVVNFFSVQRFVLPSCGLDSVLVIVLGFFSFGGQLCFTYALRFDEASTVSVTRFASRVILVFLWQTFIFGRTPHLYSIGAAVLVSVSVILTTLRKYLKDKIDKSLGKSVT